MPNWVHNIVRASDKVISACIADGQVDFRTIVPLPEGFEAQSWVNCRSSDAARAVLRWLTTSNYDISQFDAADSDALATTLMGFLAGEPLEGAPHADTCVLLLKSLPTKVLDDLAIGFLGRLYSPHDAVKRFAELQVDTTRIFYDGVRINGIPMAAQVCEAMASMSEGDWDTLQAALYERVSSVSTEVPTAARRAVTESSYGVLYDFFSQPDSSGERCVQQLLPGAFAQSKDESGLRTLLKNALLSGYVSQLDFAVANWGTKWNASSTEIEREEVSFDTAWSPPVEFYIALSAKFPDEEITVEYANEDLGHNCGTLELKGGEITSCIRGDRRFACDVWGYSEDCWADEDEDEESDSPAPIVEGGASGTAIPVPSAEVSSECRLRLLNRRARAKAYRVRGMRRGR